MRKELVFQWSPRAQKWEVAHADGMIKHGEFWASETNSKLFDTYEEALYHLMTVMKNRA
jgi:hypothetical protein